MPLRPKNPGTPPRGMRWTFVNAEDNFSIQHLHLDILRQKARDYRRLNNYPIGSNWDADFEANVCSHADSNDCFDDAMPPVTRRMVNFAKAIAGWASGGFKPVSKEVAAQRLETCESCSYYNGSSSILKVACKKCGCGGLKLMMPNEHCPLNKWNA